MTPLLSLTLHAAAGDLPCSPTDTVRAFAAAADTRDAAALERLLHPEFRVVFSMAGTTEVAPLTRAAWFGMMSEGKVGGVPRVVTIRSSAGEGTYGVVHATLTGASGTFDSVFTVVRGAGGCQVLQDALVYTPPPAAK